MPNTQLADQNLTHIVNVIDSVDLGLADKIQELLNPVYTSKYGEFFQQTFWGIPLANLIFAFLVFLFILVLRHFFTYIVITFLQNFAKRSKTYYDDRIISALKAPIRFSFIIVALHFFFLLIFKETPFIKNVLNSLMLYTLFWAILAIAEALREIVYKATAKFNDDLSKEMGGFILALIKVLISGIGLAAILQVWGVNVTALIASLGLGGLAFALAAKDTASNLFGSLALLLDRSIRIGEWVKVGGVEGVVEDVGMRTTKIRSFGKALITVPNSIVANSPIENFSRRGIRRIKMHIGLTYDTNSTQLLEIKNRIEQMLKSHEGISQKDSLMVYFDNFGDSSLDIFIYTFTNTANWAKYLETREDINVKIMQIVEECGSSFAFPSQSIYVESLPKE
jgi:MscS family membrane protein